MAKCNYCIVIGIINDAADRGLSVTIDKVNNVYVHPDDVEEFAVGPRSEYWVAWFSELIDECRC